jgi:hypothetical protein
MSAIMPMAASNGINRGSNWLLEGGAKGPHNHDTATASAVGGRECFGRVYRL